MADQEEQNIKHLNEMFVIRSSLSLTFHFAALGCFVAALGCFVAALGLLPVRMRRAIVVSVFYVLKLDSIGVKGKHRCYSGIS